MYCSSKLIGAIFYLYAMASMVFVQIIIKIVISDYGISTWEAICIRQGIITLCLIPMMIKDKFSFINKDALKLNLVRNILFTIGADLSSII